MPTMCAFVAQGWVPQAIAETINQTTDYQALQRKVATPGRSFTEVLVDIGVLDPERDRQMITHLNRHWLGSDRHGWWPHYPNKGEVLKQGLVKLVQVAGETRLPVSIYWICTGFHFQCVVAQSPAQATLLLLTPPIPNATDQPASTVAEPMWVVSNKSDIDFVVRQAAMFGGRPTDGDCRRMDAAHDIWEARIFTEAQSS